MSESPSHDAAVESIFAQVNAQTARRLSQPIVEAEVEGEMAALDRSELLQGIRSDALSSRLARHGRALTHEEVLALTRAVTKGKVPSDAEMAHFATGLSDQIRQAAAEHARRKGTEGARDG